MATQPPSKDAMPDQRSTYDQLVTLHALANEHKLYDAADHVKRDLEAMRASWSDK